MADLITTERSGRRRLVRPVRMDMTPMVDLAFLLLTFFILTTSLRRLEGLELIAPLGKGGPKADNTLTFLVGGRDTIFGYTGRFDPASTLPRRYGMDQVRSALRAVKDTAGLALFIKPRKNTRYADVIGIVDACTIAGVRHYSVHDSVPSREWATALTGVHGDPARSLR